MSPDHINAAFEFFAAIAVALHCTAIWRDKEVKGVSVPGTGLFLAWGFWNLYYYPHLDQPLSFACGIAVTVVNLAYVGMLLYYGDAMWWVRWYRSLRNAIAGLRCRMIGHRYETPAFHANCLYFCSHCGRELLDRTINDIEPMTVEQIEEMHNFDHVYQAEGAQG